MTNICFSFHLLTPVSRRIDRATQAGRNVDRQNIFFHLRNFAIQLCKDPAGRLCSRWDGRTHGFQTVIEIVCRDFGGIDLAFRELDEEGSLCDCQFLQFLGGHIRRTICYDFHLNFLFAFLLIYLSRLCTSRFVLSRATFSHFAPLGSSRLCNNKSIAVETIMRDASAGSTSTKEPSSTACLINDVGRGKSIKPASWFVFTSARLHCQDDRDNTIVKRKETAMLSLLGIIFGVYAGLQAVILAL